MMNGSKPCGLAKFDSSGSHRAPGVGVCFVPPHPNPLPQGEGWVRGNRTPAILDASALTRRLKNRLKGHMALSHS